MIDEQRDIAAYAFRKAQAGKFHILIDKSKSDFHEESPLSVMFELSESHILHDKRGRFPNIPGFAGERICVFDDSGNARER
mgnify:FL=1